MILSCDDIERLMIMVQKTHKVKERARLYLQWRLVNVTRPDTITALWYLAWTANGRTIGTLWWPTCLQMHAATPRPDLNDRQRPEDHHAATAPFGAITELLLREATVVNM